MPKKNGGNGNVKAKSVRFRPGEQITLADLRDRPECGYQEANKTKFGIGPFTVIQTKKNPHLGKNNCLHDQLIRVADGSFVPLKGDFGNQWWCGSWFSKVKKGKKVGVFYSSTVVIKEGKCPANFLSGWGGQGFKGIRQINLPHRGSAKTGIVLRKMAENTAS